jgi:predicted NUDIX family NTP pyrophosphohydrolase
MITNACPALIAWDLKGVMSLPHVVSTITSGSMAISAAGSPVVYRRDVTVPAYGWFHGGAWMARRSAALLVFRLSDERGLEVLLGHMGGPFWEKKDARAWSIPKGEYEEGEEPAAAALREFEEEMGSPPPSGDMLPLGTSRQPSGKVITTYAVEGDYEPGGFHSNTFTMEWPKGSGNFQEFPEIDRAEWMTFDRACDMVLKGHVPILERLRQRLSEQGIIPGTPPGSTAPGK